MRITLEDSQGEKLVISVDSSGDIYLCDARQRWGEQSALRFCGPGGDGAYALDVKKALRAFIQVAANEIEAGRARGEVLR